MAIWFTADLHFGHRNIIEYCSRPFADVDAMDDALIANWNATVEADDTVWVLGDLALGRTKETLPLIGSLNGHKHLLSGNHDRCWAGHGERSEPWVDRYLDAGFAEIHQGAITLTLEGTDVLACHFPYTGDSHSEDRYVEHRPPDTGRWLLHGHVHEKWQSRDRMINVGVDVWDFCPVSSTELLALME